MNTILEVNNPVGLQVHSATHPVSNVFSESPTCVGVRIPIHTIYPLQDARWDGFIENHPNASVFQSRAWLAALNAEYGYKPLAVTTCGPATPLTNAIVFCDVDSWLTGRRLVSLPFSDHCEPLVDSQDALDAMLVQTKHGVKAGRWKYVEIRPITHKPSCQTELSRFDSYHLHSLDLRLSEAHLFRNFHKDCIQRKIRRAEREKVRYEEGTSDALLEEFYRLVVMTRRRQNLPPQPLNWFRNLIITFGKDLKIRLASKDGVPVASIITLSHKKSIVYKYGCSNAAFNNLGGTALLFWKTIQEAKGRGFEELEMGRSDMDNQGLISFKEHWGAQGRVINYWAYPQAPIGLPSVWRKKITRKVVASAPDLALEVVGKLLYKHIG